MEGRVRAGLMSQTMEQIPELDRKGLREFGLVTGGIVAGLFGLALPWFFGFSMPYWPWVVGVVLVVWALAAPDTLRSVYRVWMRFGMLMSRVTTPLIMGIVFFAVMVPMGLLMRSLGHDPLARKFSANSESYRVVSRKPSRENMEKPF